MAVMAILMAVEKPGAPGMQEISHFHAINQVKIFFHIACT
jgi:hypothetical protein